VNRTPDDQPWLIRQPTSGSFFPGLSRGDLPDQRRHRSRPHLECAGDLLRRASASAEFADPFQQFLIGHSTMIPDTATPHAKFGRAGALTRRSG
jgi:hypothetical protein